MKFTGSFTNLVKENFWINCKNKYGVILCNTIPYLRYNLKE